MIRLFFQNVDAMAGGRSSIVVFSCLLCLNPKRIYHFSVAGNIKVLLNKNIENLKSLQFDHNIMKMIKKNTNSG